MNENNRLINGRFIHNLNGWTANGAAYSAGDGDDHYGVAVLSTGGDSIAQGFAVTHNRSHTLHVSIKTASTVPSGTELQAIITDGSGNTVVTQNIEPSTADTWNEITYDFGLGTGTTYTLTIINNSFGADVKVDDVWLWPVAITRANLAAFTHAKLARLASQRSLSTAASGSNTEGDYTAAVDAGLRNVGAVNPQTGEPDVRMVDVGSVNSALDAVMREMLEQLQADYAVEADISAGQFSEKRSQIGQNVQQMLGKDIFGRGGSVGRVTVRPLKYDRDDYELGA